MWFVDYTSSFYVHHASVDDEGEWCCEEEVDELIYVTDGQRKIVVLQDVAHDLVTWLNRAANTDVKHLVGQSVS